MAQRVVRGGYSTETEPAHPGDSHERGDHHGQQTSAHRACPQGRRGECTARNHLAVGKRYALGLAGTDVGVGAVGAVDLQARRLRADRYIPGHLAVFDHRRDVGPHPVEIARLGTVLHQAVPRASRLDGGPKIGECLLRHQWMTDDVVRRADQLLLREAAHLDKHVVGEDDGTAAVGARDQRLTFRHLDLVVGDRFVHAHGSSPAARRRAARCAEDRLRVEIW